MSKWGEERCGERAERAVRGEEATDRRGSDAASLGAVVPGPRVGGRAARAASGHLEDAPELAGEPLEVVGRGGRRSASLRRRGRAVVGVVVAVVVDARVRGGVARLYGVAVAAELGVTPRHRVALRANLRRGSGGRVGTTRRQFVGRARGAAHAPRGREGEKNPHAVADAPKMMDDARASRRRRAHRLELRRGEHVLHHDVSISQKPRREGRVIAGARSPRVLARHAE